MLLIPSTSEYERDGTIWIFSGGHEHREESVCFEGALEEEHGTKILVMLCFLVIINN